jgi:hypothetical protein
MTKLVTLILAALGVLAGSALGAAGSGAIRVAGPTTLTGPGIVHGALKSDASTAAVAFTTNGAKGAIALVDRKGDLHVECSATGGVVTKTRKNGKTALVCKGDATATGSGFAFAARGPKFQLNVPAGYSGRAVRGVRRHAGKPGATTDSSSSTDSSDATVAAAEQALSDLVNGS